MSIINNISVRVFGVPERIDNIKTIQRMLSLDDSHIFIDYEHKGCLWNAKRAWKLKTDKPFVMVLQDDVELCDNFLYYCNIITGLHPTKIISLFPLQFRYSHDVSKIPTVSPYISTSVLSGCGIIMKSDWVEDCISSWSNDIKGDDTNIQKWADSVGIPILTTIPAILQHKDYDSVFNSERKLGGTVFYSKNPTGVNWRNGYVNCWTNVIRR